MPIADEHGPIPVVRASYANFIWGTAREKDAAWPSLGLSTRAADDGRRTVIDVEKDSPASRAGIAVGDLIIAFDKTPIDNRETLNRVMKLVVAIVRPERLNAVLEELYKADVQGLTISRVDGHGGERQQVETFRGTTVKMELSDKVRLEIGVSNDFVDRTVQAILRSAQTGQVGDGKIFVMPVEKIYRIRTGEQDESAVTPVSG